MATRRHFLAAAGAAAVGGILLPSTTSADSTEAAASDNQPRRRGTLLLVDDFHVLYRAGTRRVLHPLVRYDHNPLIVGGDDPWALDIAWCSVHRDPASGRYQLWYQAYAGSTSRDKTRRCTVCYAESRDGLEWERPRLGLFDFNGIKDTNIVLVANGGKSDRYGAAVVFDPRDADASRRYKMAYFDFSMDGGKEYPGLSVAFSADGIHWKKHAKAPLLRCSYGNMGDEVPYTDEADRPWAVPLSMADAYDVFYDPVRDAFAAYGKMWIDGPDGRMYWKHACGRTMSKDFVSWSRPQLVMCPDDRDAAWVEFHTTPVFFHEGVYFACPQILHRDLNNGVMDVELAISRDGQKWDRPFQETFFLPRSGGEAFDSGSVFTNATPVVLEDEIRFYYGGYSQGATGAKEFAGKSGIGLATMKRDRFAGIRSVEKVGQVTMKPIDLSGCRGITLNADASRGRILVELLNDEGKRVRGFAKEDARPVVGDSLRHAVAWKGDLPGGKYMLRIHLEEAELFAVTVM